MPTDSAQGRPPAVELMNVYKKWPARRVPFRGIISEPREVLRDASLLVRTAEIVALVGENGAGKTTLLKIVAGLARPDSGYLSLFGESDERKMKTIRRRRVSYSGGERGFYFRLTVKENLMMYATLDGFRSRDATRRVQSAVEAVDLGTELSRQFADLSSGQRQRVAVARALLGDVDLLLFDEPTRTLDPLHATTLREFIRDVLVRSEKRTAIVATNQFEEAEFLADLIFVVKDGQVYKLAPSNAPLSQQDPRNLFGKAQ